MGVLPPITAGKPDFIIISQHLCETLSCAEVNRDHFGGAPTPQSGREVPFLSVSPLSDDFTPGIVFEENFTGIDHLGVFRHLRTNSKNKV